MPIDGGETVRRSAPSTSARARRRAVQRARVRVDMLEGGTGYGRREQPHGKLLLRGRPAVAVQLRIGGCASASCLIPNCMTITTAWPRDKCAQTYVDAAGRPTPAKGNAYNIAIG
jgi:hypothetical protein